MSMDDTTLARSRNRAAPPRKWPCIDSADHSPVQASLMATPSLPAAARGEARNRPRLSGRRILVVGAGTRASDDPNAPIGNGRAISVLAAREGAAVACADVDANAARGTVEWIEHEGHQATALVADVADAAACGGAVTESIQRLGGLDGLVLNVGIGAGRRLEGTSVEMWDQTFAVNLRSHFLLCKAALPQLLDGASIVFISSVAGLGAGSLLPAYDASKAGVFGLCRPVALEGSRRGVRANVVRS